MSEEYGVLDTKQLQKCEDRASRKSEPIALKVFVFRYSKHLGGGEFDSSTHVVMATTEGVAFGMLLEKYAGTNPEDWYPIDIDMSTEGIKWERDDN